MNSLTRRQFLGAAGVTVAAGVAARLTHANETIALAIFPDHAPLYVLFEENSFSPYVNAKTFGAGTQLINVPKISNQFSWLHQICDRLAGQRIISFSGDSTNLLLLLVLRDRGASILLHGSHQRIEETGSRMEHDIWVHDRYLARILARKLSAQRWLLDKPQKEDLSVNISGQSEPRGWAATLSLASRRMMSNPLMPIQNFSFEERHRTPMRSTSQTTLSILADL